MSRGCDSQLQVSENSLVSTKWRYTIFNSCRFHIFLSTGLKSEFEVIIKNEKLIIVVERLSLRYLPGLLYMYVLCMNSPEAKADSQSVNF